MGMARYGHEFLDAAFIIYERASEAEPGLSMPPVPALYLLGHGLELTFKAYLLTRGVTHAHLRRTLGHDLDKALTHCEAHGLKAVVQWQTSEETALTLLNALYSSKELEYIVTGAKVIPPYSELRRFAKSIFDAVATQIGFRGRLG